jgi:plastocyanin
MLRGIGLVLTTALLLVCCAACTEQGANVNSTNSTNTANRAATATPAATTTPAASPAASPSPGTSAPTTATVKNNGNKWQDDASGTPVTTIKVGGTVTWTITGGKHSLRRDTGSTENGCGDLEASFDTTSDLTSGQSATRTFTKEGTFGYHCGIHGGKPNCKTPPGEGLMPGVIKVVP